MLVLYLDWCIQADLYTLARVNMTKKVGLGPKVNHVHQLMMCERVMICGVITMGFQAQIPEQI